MAFDVADNLKRIKKILDHHAGDGADWIEQLIPLVDVDSKHHHRHP